MESSGIEGGNNILSSGGDNKLNLNKGSDAGEKSGRELLSKNEKTEEEPNSYKKSHESENVETKKSKKGIKGTDKLLYKESIGFELIDKNK